MKSNIILAIGLVVLGFGALFTLQGAGLVAWPQESTMIGQRDWIERGILVAIIGLGIIVSARRMRRD